MEAHIVIDGLIHRTRDVAAIREAHAAGRTLWVDLEERSAETDVLLTEVFKLHPVVSEDIWIDRVVPKVEAFDGYLHILLFGVREGDRPSRVSYWGLNIVLGATWVLTLRGAMALSPPGGARCEALLQQGPAHLAHAFLDDVVDGHVAFAEEIGQRLEKLTSESLAPTSALAPLFELRRAVRTLARLARRQLDAITTLYKGTFAVLPLETKPYLRDVYDHFVRVVDLVEDYQTEVQDLVNGLAAVQSGRTNAIMKTLTMVSTVMLPLSFIASVFGMNFKHMPEIDSIHGFQLALGLMGASAVAFIVWFRHKHWT